jgi:hypothetical protein
MQTRKSSFIITSCSKVFVWGNGENGQLGLGDSDFSFHHVPHVQTRLGNAIIERVGAGGCHSVAITDSGELWSWGTSSNGQLGLDSVSREIDITPAMQKQKQQPPGTVVVSSHKLMCFPAPCLVTSLKGICVKEVSCGSLHTACITDIGQLYVWGCGDGARLGLKDNNDRVQPTRHKAFKRHRVLKITCSKWHSLALVQPGSSDSRFGHVYSWGSGQFGQLGLGQGCFSLPSLQPSISPIFPSMRSSLIFFSPLGCFTSKRPRKVYTEAQPKGILARLISAGAHIYRATSAPLVLQRIFTLRSPIYFHLIHVICLSFFFANRSTICVWSGVKKDRTTMYWYRTMNAFTRGDNRGEAA